MVLWFLKVHRADSLRQTFSIQAWSAWSDGLSSQAQWQAWSHHPTLPQAFGGDVPLKDFPAMLRRRLSLLGKMAVAVADEVQQATGIAWDETPIVWASRYGDAQRSLQLLHSQVQGELMSPTSFGLSVHNGIAAQHSIARKVHANSVCVAAGMQTAEAGLVEALGLLADGAPHVLVVCYDAPLPEDYAQFHGEPMCAYAWAWLITHAKTDDELVFSLESVPHTFSEQESPAMRSSALPHGLQVLQCMLARSGGTWHGWRWEHGCA